MTNGRIRFIWFGLIVFGVALFGLYILHLTDMEFFVERTPVNVLIATVILAGAVVYGLQEMSFAFCRIKLRRTGFELCSVFGTKAILYKDVDFYLTQTIEKDGTKNYNWVWVCQVLFHDDRKPILLKSSRYAWLKRKMRAAIDGLAQNA